MAENKVSAEGSLLLHELVGQNVNIAILVQTSNNAVFVRMHAFDQVVGFGNTLHPRNPFCGAKLSLDLNGAFVLDVGAN